jgi:isopenicillin N synthase-like dioxygenase
MLVVTLTPGPGRSEPAAEVVSVSQLVPMVDLAAVDAARQIDEACAMVGFFSVMNHGVPWSLVDRMLAATTQFFALPMEDKLRCCSPRPDINRGYAAKGTEGLAYSIGDDRGAPDLFEAFNVGSDSRPAGDRVDKAQEGRVFAPNIWPDHPTTADLRPALTAYYEEVQRLAHRLTSLCARALALDEGFFVDKTDHSTDTIRVNNYERGAGEPDPVSGQQRMGAHTDYGILTVLYADRVPGLQIVGSDGKWHDVMPPAGALLVNLGDMLAEWTNDRWRSTLHRVVPPPRHVDGPSRRRSVAFFHDGNYDAVIECLPTCCSPENPPKYPTVGAGEHLVAKLLGPRTFTPSDAISTTGDRPIR